MRSWPQRLYRDHQFDSLGVSAPFRFQAFTLKAQGLLNRITTEIGITPAYDPKAPPNPLPTPVTVQAIWDTGATGTCLTPALAKSLGLQPTGAAAAMDHGGGTAANCPRYMVNLTLPNHVVVAGQLITELPAAQAFDVIIGMDIITHGDFSITNVTGKTWLSFRIPSCDPIDYVVEANRLVFAGTHRNAPCPCGSGTKYKKCHGAVV